MNFENKRRIKVIFLYFIIITFISLSTEITIELIDNNKEVSNQNRETMKYNSVHLLSLKSHHKIFLQY